MSLKKPRHRIERVPTQGISMSKSSHTENSVEQFILDRMIEMMETRSSSDLNSTDGLPSALALLQSTVSSNVCPAAWEAVLRGELPLDELRRYRTLQYGSKRRSWSDFSSRMKDKMATIDKEIAVAEDRLSEVISQLDDARARKRDAELTLAAGTVQVTLKEMARIAQGQFAAGPAWVVLMALSVTPADSDGKVHAGDQEGNYQIRRKMISYADDDIFLEAIRAALAAAILLYEQSNPDKVLNATPMERKTFERTFDMLSKEVFRVMLDMKPDNN